MKLIWKVVLFALLFLAVWAAHGQKIKVTDGKNEPVPNVAIFNADKSTSTVSDLNGEADLSAFEQEEVIYLQHPTFQQLSVRKSKIEKGHIVLAERILQIQTVVVSANKWEQDISEIPNRILGITDEEVIYNNPQTTADMLSHSGEVFVQKSQLGGGSPKLRGFSANSTLIVVDGVRMNNAIYRSGNLQNVISIDPNALAGTEVIMGPGSVIYGSDALGGVMDFHVRDPLHSSGDSVVTSGTILSRISTANNEKTGHGNLSMGGKKLASFSSFSHSSFDDLRSGKNTPDDYPDFGKRRSYVGQDDNGNDQLINNADPELLVPSGFDSWNIVQKLSYRPTEHLGFSYGFYFSNTSDIPRYDALTETFENTDSLANAEWYYGPQKWMMHSLRAQINSSKKFFDQARIIAAWQDYEESRYDRGFGSRRLRNRTEEVDVYSVNLDLDKSLGRHSLFYGGEFLYNAVESRATRTNIFTGETESTTTRYPDGGSNYYSGAMYASYIHRLTKFTLSAGARFTNVRLDASTDNPEASLTNSDKMDLNNSAFNGSLGGVYHGIKDQRISLMFSSGFRAPNVDDVGKVFELNADNIIVPNEGLKPEFSYNTELSWSGNSKRISWRLTGFVTLLDDAIVRGDFSIDGQDSIIIEGSRRKVLAQVNASEAILFGGSLQVDWNISNHWATSISVTETAGEDRTNNQPLRHTTPVFGRWSVIYQKDRLRGEFFSEFNGPRFRDDIPDTEILSKPYLYARHNSDRSKDGSPAWITFNLRASYSITGALRVTGALENMLDTHYRPYSSGISAAGRNMIVGLRLKF